MGTIATSQTFKNQWIYILSAIVITLFLFFIDEGFYNFQWMSDLGNWIPFLVYAIMILIGELFVSKVLLRNYKGKAKLLLSILGGSIIGFCFVIFVLFTKW